jgi:hypothetical protein|uniref:Uncharacterized protein n=1 Tax=viral metagenome TaxID=1070528 RepID=A0A6C0DWI2_9ZZZZ
MDRLMIDPKDVYISPETPQFSFEKTIPVVLVFLGIYVAFKNIHHVMDVLQYIHDQWIVWWDRITHQIEETRLKMHVKNGTFYQSIDKNI